jgi:RNA polymerase sigma factor (TIGR02999 family)
VNQNLRQVEHDNPDAAQLLPLVYAELKRVAQSMLRQERPDHTLQATALVHEAYLRLVGPASQHLEWDGQGHFFSVAAEAMRRVLIDSVRKKKSLKRGGGYQRIELDAVGGNDARRDDKLLALDAALDRLEQMDEIKAGLVKLRFFSGLTNAQAARALGISVATAERHWAFSRAWLQRAMRAQ